MTGLTIVLLIFVLFGLLDLFVCFMIHLDSHRSCTCCEIHALPWLDEGQPTAESGPRDRDWDLP